MGRIIYFILIITFYLSSSNAISKIFIAVKVENEIITNHDINKEINYLKILNVNLEKLEKSKLTNLAKNSLINELIKKKEVMKFTDIEKENILLNDYLKNLYSKLNFKNISDFETFLIKNNTYSLNEIQKKIKIELYWNELIYSKYRNQVNIDRNDILRKIENFENKENIEYLISEIVFKKDINESLKDKFSKIKLSINEIGFNNSANIFSISESAKFGGKLGWVKHNNLSSIIIKELEKITPGEITDIIKIGNNFIILSLEDIKKSRVNIEKEKLYETLVNIETNKQLNQFSKIFFDKSKINYSIDEN